MAVFIGATKKEKKMYLSQLRFGDVFSIGNGKEKYSFLGLIPVSKKGNVTEVFAAYYDVKTKEYTRTTKDFVINPIDVWED
jgi:hypothetical protein